jgi:hypothetical protein
MIFIRKRTHKKESRNKNFQDDALIELWDRAKRNVWQMDIQ